MTALAWPGFFNLRDLGGLSTRDGGRTRHGSVYRSGTLVEVTEAGWAAAVEAGVTTVLDLRDADEIAQDHPAAAVPEAITVLGVELDDSADRAFWERIDAVNGTPLYLRPFLEAKADRAVLALRAIASAGPGGVLVHCGAGRDRTGLVSLLLLSLADVIPERIADDYAQSAAAVSAWAPAHGRRDESPVVDAVLAAKGTTVREAMIDLAAGLDARGVLAEAGLRDDEVAILRSRLRSA